MYAHRSITASTLAALFLGCHPTPPVGAPRVEASTSRDVAAIEAPLPDAALDAMPPREPASDAATDAASPFFAEGAPLRPGCFAWSPGIASAACVIESATDDLTNLRVVLRFTSDAPGAVTPIIDAEAFAAGREMRPSAQQLADARARLARDGYAPIDGLRQTLRVNGVVTWAPGATASWQRRTSARGRANQATRFTDRVTIRWDPTSPPLVLTALEDRPVEAPTVAVYPIDGGRYLLLEYVGRFADEGEYGTHARAWRCDRVARACAAQ
ncbi:MAG: hypothetical protein U0326_20210 [Polyangiales bacterium]